MQHFRAQFVLPSAAAVEGPLKSRIAYLAGLGEIRQLRQHLSQDRFVAPAVMGWAEGAPNRMIDKDRARRRDLSHDIEGRAHHQGWDAPVFDHVGDETDGLMAKRSVRHQ